MQNRTVIALLAATVAWTSTVASAGINLPDFTPLVDEVSPVVTTISTEVKQGRSMRSGPTGSGFVISADGYVLTNHHVINEVETITVKLDDGRELKAKKIGDDEESDIALLKIEGGNFKAAKIGDVNKLRPGAWVLAFGAPLGLEKTVTAGIVSAKSRALGSNRYVPFIQSDVAINPGNSGGPLININGEVVGINSQILSSTGGSIGLSFSIPIDVAMDIVQQLKTSGAIARGYLGVGYQDVEQEMIKEFGLDRPRGALIPAVTKASPAEKSGLKVGDIITVWDGTTVEKSSDLPMLVGRTRPGKSVKVEIYRDGKPKIMSITVGDKKESGDSISSGGSTGETRSLGLSVGELSAKQREEAEVEHGVVVKSVDEGPAADGGIRPGDIIVSIKRKEIDSVAEFTRIVKSIKPGSDVPVLVMRRGASKYIILNIPE